MSEPTPEQLRSRFLPRLREELDELHEASGATIEHRKPVELDQQSVGRLSRMDAMQQQAMATALDARRNGRIRALEAALQRLEGEHFGWCDACGEFIGEKRLELDPTIMRCRACAK
ncbi:TraR/DksA family transcriptional regulator [Pseudotabrizicola sediminis]|uniref:TraR/DksA family transcriptional regulator n=1 Tax=Pseudotabrizicola sediminis TaxID=2486418 RepID=A0ABY2KHL2_9RHOB|nr:TraR/DksA family transcriptional regulator [Pseudotabrizicola sediminis]